MRHRTSTPDFDITVRLRNNHLVFFREALGLSAAEFAVRAGVSIQTYYRYESLKNSPINKHGQWKDSAVKIAACMIARPEEIWTDILLLVRQNVIRLKASKEEIAAAFPTLLPELALPPHPEQYVEDVEKEEAIINAVSTLTPNEQRILMLHYGLDGNTPISYEIIGQELSVSRERVRQIEVKALRKLRHSSKSRKLLEHLGDANLLAKRNAEDEYYKYWAAQWRKGKEEQEKSRGIWVTRLKLAAL